MDVRTLKTFVFFIAVIAAATGETSVLAQPSAIRLQQEQARHNGGLSAAASVTGSFVSTVKYPESGAPAYLEELAAISEAIIVGPAMSNICRLTTDGHLIVTDYSVIAERVLKGKIPEGATLHVYVVGGRVSFPNGSWAQLTPSNLRLPSNGARAVWFLRTAPVELQTGTPERVGHNPFALAAGPLGLYNLSTSEFQRRQFVLPAGAFQTELGVRIYHERLTPDAFVERVTKVAGGKTERKQ